MLIVIKPQWFPQHQESVMIILHTKKLTIINAITEPAETLHKYISVFLQENINECTIKNKLSVLHDKQ